MQIIRKENLGKEYVPLHPYAYAARNKGHMDTLASISNSPNIQKRTEKIERKKGGGGRGIETITKNKTLRKGKIKVPILSNKLSSILLLVANTK